MLVVNHDSLTFRLSASILLSLIHRGNSAPRRPWENHPQNYIKSCHTRIRPFPLKTNGTCGPIKGPPQPSAMPAGKLCRGGSINPEIKGCILYLDQSDPDQSYLLHWVYLVQEWFNLQKPPLTAGCSQELVLLIIGDHGSLCLPISTFQNDLHRNLWFPKRTCIFNVGHMVNWKPPNSKHLSSSKSSSTFILTIWTPYNSLKPRHQSKGLDHTRVC